MKHFLVLILLALVGCQTHEMQMQSWMGQPEADLVSQWGAPSKRMDLDNGERVLTWETPWGQNQLCRKSFTIDKTGIIVRWSAYGCRPATRLG